MTAVDYLPWPETEKKYISIYLLNNLRTLAATDYTNTIYGNFNLKEMMWSE